MKQHLKLSTLRCLTPATPARAPASPSARSGGPRPAARSAAQGAHCPTIRNTYLVASFPVHVRSGIGALVLVLLCSCPVVRGDDWEPLRNATASIKTLSADFVQEKHLKILVKPLVSRGRFRFAAPGSVRWEYLEPIRTATLVHRGRIQRFVFSKREGKFLQDMSATVEALRVVMEKLTGWMAGRFEQDDAFDAELSPGERPLVTLKPKSKEMSRMIERVEIQFSDRPGVVSSVKIVESPDSSTLIRFENVAVNEEIDIRLFEEIE
jgi:outer membrane lipoprotein carrier protein